MKPRLKEDPKEWRKAAWMSALGMSAGASLLRWRHILPQTPWVMILCVLAIVAIAAALQPRWFRSYYRFTTKVGHYISQFAGQAVLLFLFLFLVTPLGVVMRLFGKDLLRLRRPANAASYWTLARAKSPLDRSF
jgi:hypothetical protein